LESVFRISAFFECLKMGLGALKPFFVPVGVISRPDGSFLKFSLDHSFKNVYIPVSIVPRRGEPSSIPGKEQ